MLIACMKHCVLQHKTLSVITWAVTFTVGCLFMYLVGEYNFCYLEQWGTFFYDYHYVMSELCSYGGGARLVGSLLTQFFVVPWVGIAITAVLLSCVVTLFADVLYRLTKSEHLLPSTLFPVSILMLLLFNVNCQYSYLVSMLLFAAALTLHVRISGEWLRCVVAVVSAILLFMAAGQIATLYACVVLVVELLRDWRKGVRYLLLPAVVGAMGLYVVRAGWVGTWKHVFLPDGYFTLRLSAGTSMYLPCGLTVALFAVATLYRRFVARNAKVVVALVALQCVGVTAFVATNVPKYISADNEAFKRLNHLASHEAWDDIVSYCKHKPMTNVLHQNIFNMALAEKGALVTEVVKYPNIGVQSLFISGDKNPYILAMLSDVYFAMGHIAFSQLYAFEANESSGNVSPRMLKRLALASAIYDNKPLARKYIALLEKTHFYRTWADDMRRALDGDTASPLAEVLATKRACLFPDNRFSGSKGLDNDLEEILKVAPEHHATSQYLETIRLFIPTK